MLKFKTSREVWKVVHNNFKAKEESRMILEETEGI